MAKEGAITARASRTIKLIFSRDIINFSRARIKIISRPGRAGSGRKIIISRHGQAGPAEKNYIAAMPIWPGRKKLYRDIAQLAQHQNSQEKMWDTAFPLCGDSTKKYIAATGEKIYRGIWPGHSEKNYIATLAGWPGRKKIISRHWLLAGCLTCRDIIIFSPKNYRSIIFRHGPDAL